MRKRDRAIRCALLLTGCLLATTSHAQVRPVYDQGANALARQLQRLQTTASVLHTGAHPDDEDSALIAYHARRQHARTAYLSLTRGSGGQNIIGPEQSDLLGVIRTEELLQARSLDGAEQYFTRAVDFGFSKYLREAARVWDEDAVLEDMVRTIRLFRPTVVVSNWTGTPVDGHGHHQFAGYLTPLAYAAAADPQQFSWQLDEGLLPWQPQKLYTTVRSGPLAGDAGLLLVNTGERDAVLGRSYFAIGMQGRSQQKTQQMGSLELHGAQSSGMRLVDSRITGVANESSVFDGIDTSISGIAAYDPAAGKKLTQLLHEVEQTTADAQASYNPFAPHELIPTLARGLALARQARQIARAPDAQRLLDEKISEFESALILAADVVVDALSDTETVSPGDSLRVSVRIYESESADLRLQSVSLAMPEGWHSTTTDTGGLANEQAYRRKEQATVEESFVIEVPLGAIPTQPYWLEYPKIDAVYDWSAAGAAKNRPFSKALVTAVVAVNIGGQPVTISHAVQYREVDRVRGELRHPVNVVPALSVEPVTDLLIVPTAQPERRFKTSLTIRNNLPSQVEVESRLEVPDGWAVQPNQVVSALPARPASDTISFEVAIPDDVRPGDYQLAGVARINGEEYRLRMHEIAYPHIDTHRTYAPARTDVKVIDISVAPVRIGYVMGSGDKVPEALRRLKLDVTVIDDDELTAGDLSQFDTIVIGIRASQTRPAFVANNVRLLEFARNGGTLIVQYQQPDYIAQGLAPFPAQMERSVRVVDENAPVTILEPDHPVFNYPNRITAADFEGWVQERNNYNFTGFDDRYYVPLTESHDEGDPESNGGMLYAEIGSGHYVYTGYSWFRQLPNGVPGAYRLFGNLLSLPAAPKPGESR